MKISPRKIARHITIAALFLLPFFPLAVIPSLVVPFVTGQAFYFRILVEIAFFSWIVLAWLDADYRPKFTPLTIAVAVFAAVALIADLAGVDPLRSFWSNFDRMDGWITLVHLFALYLVMKSAFSGEQGRRLWRRWLNLSLSVAVIISIYGLFQTFGLAVAHFSTDRVDASFGHPTFLAAYLIFQVFLAAYVFVDVWNDKSRSRFSLWIYVVSAMLFTLVIFETGTRGTFLGLIIGAIAALIVFVLFGARSQRRWRLICASLIGLVVLMGLAFWLNRNQPFIQKNAILVRFASISWTASDQSRQYIWPAALKGISEKPLLGWGQENFSYLFQKHYDPAMYDREQWADRAHDIFLDQLAAAGVIGLAAYLVLFIVLLLAIRRSSLEFAEKCLIIGLLTGYIVHDIFVFDTLGSYVFFFAVMALVDSLGKGPLAPAVARQSRKLAESLSPLKAAAGYVLPSIAAIACAATVYFFNVRPFLANVYLSLTNDACSRSDADTSLFKKALYWGGTMSNEDILVELVSCTENVISNPLVSGAAKQSFIDLTSERIKAQIAETPKDAYAYYVGGPFLKQIGRLSEAESLLNTAHLLAPNEQVISFELASVYLFEDKTRQASDVLGQAYGLAPRYGTAALAYAVALLMSGDEKGAMQVFGADRGILSAVKADLSTKQYSKAVADYQAVIASPISVSALIQQARIQYAAGNTAQAIAILRSIEAGRPQDKDQIEAAIKAVQPAGQ